MKDAKYYSSMKEMLLDWIQWHKDSITRLEVLLEKHK